MDCPNCGRAGPKPVWLTVHFATPDHPLRHSRLLACADLEGAAGCSGLFYENQTPPDYTEGAMLGRGRVAFYLQQGAGLSLITRPLSRVVKPPGSIYLEVGCGFGFGLDFAIRAKGWQGQGIDPGGIAALGETLLGVPIEQRYLGADEPRWRGRCDVVMASETIEHVPSPPAFIATLRAALRPGGVLILTTPNGGELHRGQSQGLLVPLLSPGLHLVFQTAASLRKLLDEAGFAHMAMETDGSSLIAYASDAPLDLQDDRAVLRRLYRNWLAARAAQVASDGDLFLAFAGRWLQEAVNDAALDEGAMAEAARAWALLVPACAARFGLDLAALEALPAGAGTCSLARLEKLMPLNLGGILHADAIRRLAAGAERAAMARRFTLAADAADAMRRALGELAMEDGMSEAIAWAARAEALLCDAAAGLADVPARLCALPPAPAEAGAGAIAGEARKAAIVERAFVGAVNARAYALGHEIAASFDLAALDPADPAPLSATRRDALFCLGVLALQPDCDPARARALLARVRRVEQVVAGPGRPPSKLFWAALRGELQATERLEDAAASAELHRRVVADLLAAGAAVDAAPDDLRPRDAPDAHAAEPSLLRCEGLS